jgi:hypothetical protein
MTTPERDLALSGVSTRFLAIRTAIAEMQGEAEYIRGELSRFEEDHSVREVLGSLVDEMNGALWDARSEYQMACEKLSADSDDDDLPNRDPTICVRLSIAAQRDLMGCLADAMEQLMPRCNDRLAELGLALIVSCGENLVQSFTSAQRAEREIDGLLYSAKPENPGPEPSALR